MIKNKAAAKQALQKRYPTTVFTPIYSTPAYIISKPLDEIDAFEYFQHTLSNGQYMIFIGVDGAEVNKLVQQITTGTVPKRRYNRTVLKATVPTTFTAFTKWMDRNNITWVERKFYGSASPVELLAPDKIYDEVVTIPGCVAPRLVRAWYAYELNNKDIKEEALATVPHIRGETTTVLLIKAASSSYVSKRQRILNKIKFMQPLYEQLKEALASNNEEKAILLAKQYFSTQFDVSQDSIQINYKEMEKAYAEDRLTDYVRDSSVLDTCETIDF